MEMNKGAILRAADWLEANPDKHIIAKLATNDCGWLVEPTGPMATCFCAMGRIAKEAGFVVPMTDCSPMARIGEAVGMTPSDVSLIWVSNDAVGTGSRGNPNVINVLRRIAA